MASQHNPPHASAQTSPATSLPMQKSSVTAVPKPAGLKEVLKKTKQPASRRRKLPSNFPITETTPEDRATSRNANVMASQSTITTAQSVLSDEEAGSSVEDLIASAQQYMAAPINEEAHGSVRPGEQPARAEGSKKRKASAKLSKDESAAKKRKPATKTASVKNACASSCSNAKLPVYRPYISDDEDDSEPEHPTFTHRCTRRDPGSLGRTFTVITRGTASHKHIEETILHTSKVREECCWLYRKVKGAGGDLKLMELDSDAFRIWWEEWLYAGKVVFDLGPEVGEDGSGHDPGDILQSVLETYVLGQQMEYPEFCYAVILQACKISDKKGLVFRNEVTNQMYALTDPGCALRRWIVDEFVWEHDADSEDPLDFEEFKELNPEFLLDVVREQGRRLGGAVGERELHRKPADDPEKYKQ